jgi:hypothetical protein
VAAPTFAWINTTGVGSSTSASPIYPATGVTAGDTIYCVVEDDVSSGSTEPPDIAVPSGWTLVCKGWGGAGVAGIGTGPRKVTVIRRDALADGTENGTTGPAIANPSGSTFVYATLFGLRPATAGNGFVYADSSGSDTVSDTSFSAAMAADPGLQTDDLVVGFIGLPDDTGSSLSAEGITATGATFGTATEQFDNATSSGNDGRFGVFTAAVTAGTSSAAPTITATIAGAFPGVGMVLRVREVATVVDPTAWLSPLSRPTGLQAGGLGSFLQPWWDPSPPSAQIVPWTVTVAAAGSPALARQVGKQAQPAAAGTLAVGRQTATIRQLAAAGTPTLTRQAGKQAAASVAAAVSTLAQKVKLVSVAIAASGAVAVRRQVGKLVQPAATGTAAILRVVSRTLPVSVAAAVSTTATKVKLLTVAVAAAASVAVSRQTGKLASVVAAGTPIVVRQVGKRAAITSAGALTVTRQAGKQLAVATVAAVATTATKVKLVTVSVAATAGVLLSRQVGKPLQTAATGALTLAKQATRKLTLAANGTAGVVAQKVKFVTIAVAASGAVAVRKTAGKLASIAAAAVATAGRVPNIVAVIGKRLEATVAHAVGLAAAALGRATPTGQAARSDQATGTPARTSGPEPAQTGHGLVERDPKNT